MGVSCKNQTLHRSKLTQVAKTVGSTQVLAALAPPATVINIPVRHKKQVPHLPRHHQKRKVVLRRHHHPSHQSLNTITTVTAVVTTTIHPVNLSLHTKGIKRQRPQRQQLQNLLRRVQKTRLKNLLMRLSRTCSVSLSKGEGRRARLRKSRMKSPIPRQVQARQVPPQVVQKVRQKVKTKTNQAAEVLPLPNQPVQAIQVPVTRSAVVRAAAPAVNHTVVVQNLRENHRRKVAQVAENKKKLPKRKKNGKKKKLKKPRDKDNTSLKRPKRPLKKRLNNNV